MSEGFIRHMLIVEGKKLLGVISKSDVLKYSISKAFSQGESKANDKVLDPLVTIDEIMTKSVTTLKDYDTVKP
jgi:CBS domain-containing protein